MAFPTWRHPPQNRHFPGHFGPPPFRPLCAPKSIPGPGEAPKKGPAIWSSLDTVWKSVCTPIQQNRLFDFLLLKKPLFPFILKMAKNGVATPHFPGTSLLNPLRKGGPDEPFWVQKTTKKGNYKGNLGQKKTRFGDHKKRDKNEVLSPE